MKVRFLLDENLSPRLRTAVLRRVPVVDILRVGDEGAPTRGTLDPDILRSVEHSQRMLVTTNRASMPAHITNHLQAGGHHWGVSRVRPSATMSQVIDALVLIAEASEAEEWIDQFGWIPF